ncbi:biotin/lipoyl-containing protein [Rhodoferax antarcticus]|uniref:Biotin carboxyl carrier protein n=1 Tax=Rhodoferax antarcticus ANT.BR TaxID=1111071 RepID=A0A1Q8YA64_9BURK|nr:biotin/lipoyl-containing protein [Rhodoferax antarcticus]APW47074.1 hypothetical protein RA876_12700 [Rhodoferax antarcticus]MCW2311587.1 biotin carboxyl carrier protein [Rhodoferax antarcticus]OLP04951.1 biotin carboxyl carrier protein [Rhodoferax antarcticus ANT.BR]
MTRLFKVTVNGREYDVAVLEMTPGTTPTAGQVQPMPSADASAPMVAMPARAPTPVAAPASASATGDEVAQMGGVIIQVNVKVGQNVAVGDSLLVLEAMKMKNHLLASRAGSVMRILVGAGDVVESGQPLLTIQ